SPRVWTHRLEISADVNHPISRHDGMNNPIRHPKIFTQNRRRLAIGCTRQPEHQDNTADEISVQIHSGNPKNELRCSSPSVHPVRNWWLLEADSLHNRAQKARKKPFRNCQKCRTVATKTTRIL